MRAAGVQQAREWQRDNQQNIEYFSVLLKRHRIGARVADWSGPRSQRRRFAVLAGIGELRDCRILDVGCGLGDFAQWLAQHDIDVHYTGLDVTPAVIERAKRRLPQGRFFQGDILSVELPSGKFDYVFCSGIFTHRRRNPKAFFHASIRRMFELCRAGVAFNCLSAWAGRKETLEFHADPLETLRFCRTLTQWVTLRHDYHPGDFTIYLYRRPR